MMSAFRKWRTPAVADEARPGKEPKAALDTLRSFFSELEPGFGQIH